MNIRRFIINFEQSNINEHKLLTSRNELAKDRYSNLLDATVNNMIEELNTIIREGKIDKDELLKSLLEDAEHFPLRQT